MRDTRYQWAYLFGAVCPDRGVGAGLVMPYANTEAMNRHLEEIGKAVAPGAHAALILDGAGWHDSQDLVMPQNITPIILPPYSPELNPAENVWEYLRKNKLANRLYETYEDIVEACPHRIHCRKNLGKGVITYGGWYHIALRVKNMAFGPSSQIEWDDPQRSSPEASTASKRIDLVFDKSKVNTYFLQGSYVIV